MTNPVQNKLLKTSDARALSAGESYKGIYIVSGTQRKTDKNGKTFWDISVSDERGTLNAKVWSDAGWVDRSNPDPESKPGFLAESEIASLRGRVVGVNGKTVDFRGQVQHNFNTITLLDEGKFPPSNYVAHSEIPLDILDSRFDDLIGKCSPEIRDFLRFVFDGPRLKVFREAPAAVVNHHAYANGLLEHSVSVTEAALAIANHYRDIYPSLNVSLVIAGALLHDIGKTSAYNMSPIPEITVQGAVLDHIAIGFAEFSRLADEAKLAPDVATQIGHIILSHHGQKQFGSPVLPATPEALIVASADELDFRLFCWNDATLDMAAGQSISAFNFATERRFWRPPVGGDDAGR
jgi:3'-5' exoribonuclease